MSEGYMCDHCKVFKASKPFLKGTFKRETDDYSFQFTLCKGCAEYITG